MGDLLAVEAFEVVAPDGLERVVIGNEGLDDDADTRKLIAAICHGGWIPISAGVYTGIRVTGSPGIKDDLIDIYKERLADIEEIIRREDIITLPERDASIRPAWRRGSCPSSTRPRS